LRAGYEKRLNNLQSNAPNKSDKEAWEKYN
jgi:hypothetical protein